MNRRTATKQDMASPKEITNPFSTGGGGVSYEQRVAAYYMVCLLAQSKPLGLPTGIAQSIRFQARQLGATLDDLLILSCDDSHIYRMQLQVKHNLTFTDNVLFQEVLADAWLAFIGAGGYEFNPDQDRIGLVVPGYSKNVHDHLLQILRTAETSISADEFLNKIGTSNFASSEKRRYLELFKTTLNKAASATIPDEQIWKFLKCFVILSLDLESEVSKDVHTAWNTLLSLIPNRSVELAHTIFNTLIKLSGEYAPLAGTCNLQTLQRRLYREIPSLRVQSDFFNDLELKLQRISSVFVPSLKYESAKIMLMNRRIVILTGPAHVGKTATAFKLAIDLQNIQDNLSIVKLSGQDKLVSLLRNTNSIVIIDDCFGQLTFSSATHGENLDIIIELSKRNYVILTSRTEVYAEAEQKTRLSETPEFSDALIELHPADYNDECLINVLQNHLNFVRSEAIPERERPNAEQVRQAMRHTNEIIQQLRFPHNIDLFCRQSLKHVGPDLTIQKAIEKSRKIEQVVKQWVEGLPVGPHYPVKNWV